MKNYKFQSMIGAPLGYLRLQIDCVFAENDLFKPTIFIQHFIFIDFRINLTHFSINFSRQEHQIELLWVSYFRIYTINGDMFIFAFIFSRPKLDLAFCGSILSFFRPERLQLWTGDWLNEDHFKKEKIRATSHDFF